MANNHEWIDRGSYWEHTSNQKDPEWEEVRLYRTTSSVVGALVGHSSFKTPEDAGQTITGHKFDVKSENQAAMDHGNKTEDDVRRWYERKYNCQVIERGLAVPKWDIYIGASIDGEVVGQDKIIEIKCPRKGMYKPILKYMELKNGGWNPPRNYHDHIFNSHYDQMQHCMAVLGKKSCEYIVYSTMDGMVFNHTVHFDRDYWNLIYKIAKNNFAKYVGPFIPPNYPITPM